MSNNAKGARAQHKSKKPCPVCGKMLSAVGFTNHIRSRHPESSNKPTPIPEGADPSIRSAIEAIDLKIEELGKIRASLLNLFPNSDAPARKEPGRSDVLRMKAAASS